MIITCIISISGKILDNIKKYWWYDSAYSYWLTNSNELYDKNGTKIANVPNGIKNFYCYNDSEKIYYITENSELYNINGTKIANNVKELYGDRYYLTEDNKLCELNGTEIAKDFKKINQYGYLTINNEFYSLFERTKIADNVYNYGDSWYQNDDGIFYYYELIEDDNPIEDGPILFY